MKPKRSSVILASVCALLFASACSGPSTPINASLKAFPQSVLLASAKVPEQAIAPIPPSAPEAYVGLITSPAASAPRAAEVGQTPASLRAPLPPPPPAAACPTARPGAVPTLAAGPDIPFPPAKGSYAYRTSGSHTVGGANAGKVDYPAQSRRDVSPPRMGPSTLGGVNSFSYDVTTTLGSNQTVTTYQVVSGDSLGGLPTRTGQGLYVTKIVTIIDGKSPATFTPQPSLLVLPFPADPGTSFNASGTDQSSGTTVAYSGIVGAHEVVDACGSTIDTRSVTHTGSVSIRGCGTSACSNSAATATNTTQFTSTYDIATQYGGLSVKDHVHIDGVGLDAPFADDLTGVINRVPETR